MTEPMTTTEPNIYKLADMPEPPTDAPNAADWPAFLDACLDRNEYGDAELFAALFAGKVLYDHAEKQWYLWRGFRWERDETGEVFGLIGNQVAAEYLDKAHEERANNQVERSKDFVSRAKALLSRRRTSNAIELATHLPRLALTGSEWDIDPMLLPIANGLIDLRTGAYRETTPSDYVRTFSPVEWRGLNTPAPLWEKTLLQIFGGDADLVNFARRLFGYAITGTTREQVLPILYGEGANGKSTILEVLLGVLGRDFCFTTQADSLMDTKQGDGDGARPFVYALRGKRLALASESKESQKLNAGLVKQLTGDSEITARTLHSKPVTFRQTHKIMLITNHCPRLPDGDDYAMWRRVIRIPFNVRFVENPTQAHERKIDKNLPASLENEYAGILAWLVRGCLEWQKVGLTPPTAVLESTEQYREDEDLTGQFVDERMIIGDGYEAMSGLIYNEYKKWCEEYGYKPMSSIALSKRLKRKFGEPVRSTKGYFYRGIGLIT